MNWLADSFMIYLSPGSAERLLTHGTVDWDDQPSSTSRSAYAHIVVDGKVRVYAEHSDALVSVAGAGDLLYSRFTPMPGSIILRIPWRRISALVSEREMTAGLMHAHEQIERDLMAQIHSVGQPADVRLWSFLTRTARRHGSSVIDGTLLDIGLTRSDYGAAIRAAASSVDGALRRLRSAGRVKTGYGWVLLRTRP